MIGAEAGGFEPPVRLPVRQFSKLVVSATHPNFLPSLRRGSWRIRTAVHGFADRWLSHSSKEPTFHFFACNRCFSIASAKVQLFSESASVSKTFFIKSCIFFISASFCRGASGASTAWTRTLVSLYTVDILNDTSHQPNETTQNNDSDNYFL